MVHIVFNILLYAMQVFKVSFEIFINIYLVWRLLCNRLPTKDNLVRQGVLLSIDPACVGGYDHIESATHLFLHCNVFGLLWSFVWN